MLQTVESDLVQAGMLRERQSYSKEAVRTDLRDSGTRNSNPLYWYAEHRLFFAYECDVCVLHPR